MATQTQSQFKSMLSRVYMWYTGGFVVFVVLAHGAEEIFAFLPHTLAFIGIERHLLQRFENVARS